MRWHFIDGLARLQAVPSPVRYRAARTSFGLGSTSLIGAFRTNGLGGSSMAEQCLDAWLMWGSSLRQCFLRLSSCLILSFLLLSSSSSSSSSS